MIFEQTGIEGLLLIRIDYHQDMRGSFGRTFCRDEFQANGLPEEFVQTSSSRTHQMGTIRGMHWQASPHAESKLVRCVRGTIHDIVCDMRRDSATYLGHRTFTMRQDDDLLLSIPPGCAHGFQTLSDDVEVLYSMSRLFAPVASRGMRYDDRAFSLNWPLPIVCISDKDLQWPSFADLDITSERPE